jgi:hypothetical protein
MSAQCLVVFLGAVSLVPLLGAPGGLWNVMTEVPLPITALLGLVRLEWTSWMTKSVQYAPNPGFAKMAVNMNTGTESSRGR